jgi:hypothetical protein
MKFDVLLKLVAATAKQVEFCLSSQVTLQGQRGEMLCSSSG